jgi:hypothetical protein
LVCQPGPCASVHGAGRGGATNASGGSPAAQARAWTPDQHFGHSSCTTLNRGSGCSATLATSSGRARCRSKSPPSAVLSLVRIRRALSRLLRQRRHPPTCMQDWVRGPASSTWQSRIWRMGRQHPELIESLEVTTTTLLPTREPTSLPTSGRQRPIGS